VTTEATFLRAILAEPTDETTWLALADWLDEHDDPRRAELVRLQVLLRHEKRWRARSRPEKRAQELLAAGVRPCVPTWTNSAGIEFALVPPGAFWMGSTRQQLWSDDDEHPRHRVALTRAFHLGVYQVTQEQYERVTGKNPSWFQPGGRGAAQVKHLDTRRLPVDSVSYEDIETFCRKLSALPEEKKAGRAYRLPTEAEWEYACRAGVCHHAYHFGPRLTRREARYGGMGGGHPVPVGSHRPNLFGLHDMHGNVWEWCEDWYAEAYYRSAISSDPIGPENGIRRVLRGGGWSTPVDLCRSALRGHNRLDARHNYNGFRLALSIAP
jgi:uncharacterized protein (TIGR02996 family)